jgi:hypothetical protein
MLLRLASRPDSFGLSLQLRPFDCQADCQTPVPLPSTNGGKDPPAAGTSGSSSYHLRPPIGGRSYRVGSALRRLPFHHLPHSLKPPDSVYKCPELDHDKNGRHRETTISDEEIILECPSPCAYAGCSRPETRST